MDRSLRALLLGGATTLIGLLIASMPSSTLATDEAVSIVDFAFQPNSAAISAGNTITWTNKAGRAHTVTADDGSFDSGDLAANDAFANVFGTAGRFTYHCSIHPRMTGAVVVKAAAATPSLTGSPPPTPPPGTLPPGFGAGTTPSASVAESIRALPSPSPAAQAPTDSSGSSALPWILLAVVAGVAIIAFLLPRRVRR